MKLFNSPENEFVAGFLGSPKMNFFSGYLDNISENRTKGTFRGDTYKVDEIRLVSQDKGVGDNIKLGVRPQHLYLDKNGPIKGKVILIEQLGTEIIIELETSDNIFFRFTSPENPNLTIGQSATFNFKAEFAHLF
jgi:multiple sugar transport system ATP-binding protein